jgi:hypothetical protein
MGFLDKAKRVAEQAQAKLDEAQKNINKSGQQQPGAGGPIVEYDKHGRPIQSAPVAPDAAVPAAAGTAVPAAVSTPAVPQTGDPAPVAADTPVPDPAAPGVPATAAPSTPAAAPPGPTPPEDRNKPSNEPPKMSSGDPLAG